MTTGAQNAGAQNAGAQNAGAQASGSELDEALIRAIRQLIAGAVQAEESDGAVSVH